MKKITLLLSLIAFLAAPAVKAQSERSISNFNSINVSGPMTVYITMGENNNLRIEADKDDLDNILTEVKSNTLEISSKALKSKKDVIIYVTARELTYVGITGSGKVIGRSVIKSPSLQVNLTGSGNMALDVGVNDLKVDVTGSGNLVLTGQTQDLKMRVSGSGDADALKMHAQKADIHVSGSGNALVNVNGDLTGSITGSGDIAFTGIPNINNINLRGSGKLRPAF
ncbi:MAG: head GIN domain-containing protein [Bacteroidia bacterium]